MFVRMRELSVVVVRKHSVILMKATLIALLIRGGVLPHQTDE